MRFPTADELLKRRTKLGLSQREVAAEANVRASTLSSIELNRTKTKPRLETLVAVSEAIERLRKKRAK